MRSRDASSEVRDPAVRSRLRDALELHVTRLETHRAETVLLAAAHANEPARRWLRGQCAYSLRHIGHATLTGHRCPARPRTQPLPRRRAWSSRDSRWNMPSVSAARCESCVVTEAPVRTAGFRLYEHQATRQAPKPQRHFSVVEAVATTFRGDASMRRIFRCKDCR